MPHPIAEFIRVVGDDAIDTLLLQERECRWAVDGVSVGEEPGFFGNFERETIEIEAVEADGSELNESVVGDKDKRVFVVQHCEVDFLRAAAHVDQLDAFERRDDDVIPIFTLFDVAVLEQCHNNLAGAA